MEMLTSFSALTLDETVAQGEFVFTRDSLVRYAGASLDFNPIHYRDDFARSVGLPGVLAHGMLTMGAAASVVTDLLGAGVEVAEYQVKFTKPVPVDAEQGAKIAVDAVVAKLDEEAQTARIDLKVRFGELTVLGRSQLTLRFRKHEK